MGTLVVIESILELVTMDGLVLTVMHEGGIWVDLLPLAGLRHLGVVAWLAAGELNWLIVFWQHLLSFCDALVGPKSRGNIAWGRTFAILEKIFDDRSVLERCSSLEEKNLEVVWDC